MKRTIKQTKQERKNHKWFFINIILYFSCIGVLGIGLIEESIFIYFIGSLGLVFGFFSIYYNGYAHGWELKRISMLEEEEDEE